MERMQTQRQKLAERFEAETASLTARYRELEAAGRVTLSDAYFVRVTSLNSDYTRLTPLTFNAVMGPLAEKAIAQALGKPR